MAPLVYSVLVEPLTPDEGGGYAATVPDLPGCMSDGDTSEDVFTNVRDAIAAWIEAAREMGQPVSKPAHEPTVLK